MKTTNELLLDLSVRHQFYINRLGKGNARKAADLIQLTIEDIERELGYRWTKIVDNGVPITGARSDKHRIALIAALVEIRSALIGKIEKGLFKDLRAAAKFEVDFTQKMLTKVLPIEVSFAKPSASVINAAVNGSIVDGRIVKDQFSSMNRRERDHIKKVVGIGIVRGQSYAQIIRAFKRDNSRVERGVSALIQTATHSAMTKARIDSLNESDLVKGYNIQATLDSRTSPICQLRDGQFKDKDSKDLPPYHYNCRTAAIPVTKSWREIGIDKNELDAGTRASMNGQVPADLSYKDWIKTQPRQVQVDALGSTRARLLRDGKIEVDKLIDKTTYQFTPVKELAKRYGDRFPELL